MDKNKIIFSNYLGYSIVIFSYLVDRVSKYLILDYFENLNEQSITISNYLSLKLIWNDGVAFGLFSFNEKIYYNILTAIIFLIILIISWLFFRSKNIEKIGYSLIIGGAIGNLTDRLIFRSVIDFIDLHVNNYHWFIFNFADIFISFGITLLIINEFVSLSRKN